MSSSLHSPSHHDHRDETGIIQRQNSTTNDINKSSNQHHVTITEENVDSHNNNGNSSSTIINNPLLQKDYDDTKCCWWFFRIPTVLFISFMLGVALGVNSATIPNLQSDTFGNSSFMVVGGFGGGKGLLALGYTPIVGSLSDEKSRFYVLMATMVLSLIPYAAMTILNNFWIYTISNMVFGLYNISFTLLVIIICSRVPQTHKSRTLALSTNVAVFLFGVGGASFLGPLFTERVAFGLALLCQFLCGLAAFLFLRKSTNAPNKYFHLAEVSSSSNGSYLAYDDKKHIREDENNEEESPNNNNQEHEEKEEEEKEQKQDETSSLIPQQQNNTSKKDESDIVNDLVSKNKKSYSIRYHIARAWKLYASNRNIRVLFVITFFNYLTSDMLDQMLLLYLQQTLDFTDNQQTYTIAVMSVASILFVIFIAVTRDTISDTWVLRLALTSSFIMTCLYAVVQNKLFAIMLPAVNVIGMAALPAVSALTADSVDASQVGVGQGCVQASRVLANVICPFMYGALFEISWDQATMQGWPFFVAAGCILISILATFMLKF